MAGERVLRVVFEGSATDLNRSIASTKRSMSSLGTESTRTSGLMGRFGNVAGVALRGVAVGAGIAVTAIGALAVKSVMLASDFGESVNKINVVFGKESGQQIVNWSKTTADAFGLSQNSALEAAGTFGNLFTAMDIGAKPAKNMSVGLVELSADLASFNNKDPSEVLEALRSGIVGETEPLRALGVQLSAVRVSEEAMRMGLAKTPDALTASDKAFASYELILQDTKKAHGDFENTSNSLPNLMRRIKATVEDTGKKIGMALLPTITKLTKKIAEFVQSDAFKEWLKDAVVKIKEFISSAKGAVQSIAEFWSRNGDDIKQWARRIGGFFTEIGGLIRFFAKELFGPGGATSDIADVWRNLQRAAGNSLAFISRALGTFVTVFFDIGGRILDIAAKAFGWMPGIGDKVRKMRTDFKSMGAQIDASLKRNEAAFDKWGNTSLENINLTKSRYNELVGFYKDNDLRAPPPVPAADPKQGDGPGAMAFGSSGGGGVAASWAAAASAAISGSQFISGYRSPAQNAAVGGSATSYHLDAANPAQDISGSNMLPVARWLAARYGQNVRELIHTPLGFSIINGVRTAPVAPSDHYDHVHLADKGGMFQGPGLVRIGNIKENIFQPAKRIGDAHGGGDTYYVTINAGEAESGIRELFRDEMNRDARRRGRAKRARFSN